MYWLLENTVPLRRHGYGNSKFSNYNVSYKKSKEIYANLIFIELQNFDFKWIRMCFGRPYINHDNLIIDDNDFQDLKYIQILDLF